MSSDGRDLQVILAAQERRELALEDQSQIMNEMKSSLIFQCNWEELLQAAPTAISYMGACFVASSSPKAVVQLTPPKDKGFQYLRYTSVQANLIECGNIGRMAFLEAEKGMGVIQLTSQVIDHKINDIVRCIGDPISAKKMLRPQLSTLKSGAASCLQRAMDIDKKFEEWLLYVCEIHAACAQEENDTRNALLNNEIYLAAEQTRLDYQKSTAEEAKKAQEAIGKQVTAASAAFKKASDEFPSGWDLLGQQIVSDLVGALTSTLNVAVPTLLSTLNPIAKVKAAVDVVGGFVNPPKSGNVSATANGRDDKAGSNAARLKAVPKVATDPAYVEVLKISTYLDILRTIVSGKKADGNIDWEMADGGSKATAKSSIKFLVAMLDDSKARFEPLATSEKPSETLLKILDVSLRVANDIKDEIDRSKIASSEWPKKDSEQVKKWQSDFAAQYRESNTLIGVAKTIPGTSANGIPLTATDPAVTTAQISTKSLHAQAVLESAKNRLTTTSQMLTNSQETYAKSTEMLLEQENKLADVRAKLTKLTGDNVSLTEIKRILLECIKLIVELKSQITNLVRFFNTMTVVIEICINLHVDPFLETVNMIVAEGDDPHKSVRIGDYTLTDFQRAQVHSAATTMRSYFSVFGDIAKMWVDLSKENVLPGLRLCDELSITADEKDPGAMSKKVMALNQWSSEAAGRVRTIARQRQKEIMDGMESRINEVQETTQLIAPPPQETIKAITAGTEVTKQAAQDSVAQRAKRSPLSRFGELEYGQV
ncbi:hypothetical protein F4810DRAFT_703039 [Camillea tinctor]|nr:hypothetical protein F4810DRAFT_703039 [Camillea tinctor]